MRKCFILFTEQNGERTEKTEKSEFSNQLNNTLRKTASGVCCHLMKLVIINLNELILFVLPSTIIVLMGDYTQVRTRFYKLKFDGCIMT